MALLRKVFAFIIVTFVGASCQKNDESRAYEFGFTIDGQQHRHEKKDVNGIIQGEFGFITADGIYHVTVYATDENGNFKILSMRNVRISAPLDGSPLPQGQKIAANPYGGGGGQVQQPQPATPQQPQSFAQPQPEIHQTTNKPRSTYAFTTQPTIKPACGGCGYVTTPKPIPGQRFPFQTPAFQNPIPETINTDSQPGSGIDTAIPRQDVPYSNIPNPSLGLSQQQQLQQTPSNNVNPPNLPSIGESKRSDYPNGHTELTYPNPNTNYPSGPNEVDVRSKKPLSQVSVSNGAIHVPGNPDIQIRDKFPGMVDGLPDGIGEKDITDLLYKFNYTVGFHGHYEKGLKNGAKVGGYFVTGRDGISRIVTYVADENGFRPKVKFVRLDLGSDEVPKEGTEKKFGLKNFEFVWYPIN